MTGKTAKSFDAVVAEMPDSTSGASAIVFALRMIMNQNDEIIELLKDIRGK